MPAQCDTKCRTMKKAIVFSALILICFGIDVNAPNPDKVILNATYLFDIKLLINSFWKRISFVKDQQCTINYFES